MDWIIFNNHLFFLAGFVVQHVSCWSGNTKSTAFPQEFGHLVSNSLPEFKHAKYKDGGDEKKKREIAQIFEARKGMISFFLE